MLKNFLSAAITAVMFISCTPSSSGSAIDDWEHLFDNEEKDDDPVQDEEGPYFLTRGLVFGWSDANNSNVLDYIQIAKENGLNTFSVYGADRNSSAWKDFAKKCADADIKLEYEEHMMSFLLPRSLFDTHPEYFRMTQGGARVNDANGCPSCKEALEIVREQAKDIGLRYAPTNNRYYFWLDDGGDICHCEKCKELNAADQALIYENVVIEALKEINPDAMLAHLCYDNTLEAPSKTVPHEDIFLEFAPFYRNWASPLKDTWVTGRTGVSHANYLKALKQNLNVFPKSTAQVLEYWMDESLVCGWNPDKLVKLPWNKEVFLSDLATYASYGIRHITCYCAFVGPNYVNQFGHPYFLEEYGQGLLNYEKK